MNETISGKSTVPGPPSEPDGRGPEGKRPPVRLIELTIAFGFMLIVLAVAYVRLQGDIEKNEAEIEANNVGISGLQGAMTTLLDRDGKASAREPMCKTANRELMSAISQQKMSTDSASAEAMNSQVNAYKALRQVLCVPVKKDD